MPTAADHRAERREVERLRDRQGHEAKHHPTKLDRTRPLYIADLGDSGRLG
jgi:hypothetical protein